MIPQDLQLIQDLVADLTQSTTKELATPPTARPVQDDSILSSDDDDASSEKEVEADILCVPDDEAGPLISPYVVELAFSSLLPQHPSLEYCRVQVMTSHHLTPTQMKK